MYARQVDQRSAIFQKALEVGEAYQLRTKVGFCIDICTYMYIVSCCNCLVSCNPQALLMRSLMQKKGMTVSVSGCVP